LSGSDNLKHHEALLEEMRKLESDKLLVLDRVYRYEFAQPTDDGKLYSADTTFGKIRACNWEPHEYVYDTKEIGGSTRCWKVGEAVLLAKEKKSVIGVVPVLFLRGSGPKAKHRVVLHTPTPSPEFAGLNRGLKRDARFATRLLDQFSEEALHAAGDLIKSDTLHNIQEEAWSFLKLDSKSKTTPDIDDEHEGEVSTPAAASKRTRPAPKRRHSKMDDTDEPSEPAAIATANQLHQHLQHEKEHEKEHKKDLKRLNIEIEDLRGRTDRLEQQLEDVKKGQVCEKDIVDKKLKKLKDKITPSLQQSHLALMQVPAAATTSFTTAAQQALPPVPAQLPFVPVQTGGGGYFYFPASALQGASGRSG